MKLIKRSDTIKYTCIFYSLLFSAFTPKSQLAVTEIREEVLRFNIDYYIKEFNSSRYANFSCILEDLISGKAYFIKRIE